ncbi:MAG: ATP-binding cassette domain-containing protein [Acidimicrobiales bacterium]
MGDVLEYAIRGVPIGCVFALLAVGLVLNFKTTGVFNLAFAAQAYASAAVFYVTRHDHEWPLLPAALLSIIVVGPLIGIILDRFLYRHQRTASPLAKLVTSLGLLVAVPELVKLWFGQESKKNPPPLWPVKRTDEFLWPSGSRYVLDAGQIATLACTAVVVIGLTLLFRRGALGLRMRAVVESPRLLRLQGVDAERVALVSWILTSALAGLAGVLIAPLFAQLNSFDFFTLLVAAIAACVVGNLTSIVGTFLGGLMLGVLQAVLAGVLPTDSVLASGLRPSLPFVVLFGLLLVGRSVRSTREVSDPLAGVDPPPAPPAATLRPPWMTLGTRIFGLSAAVIGLAVSLWVLDDFWVGLVTGGVCLGVILLSIVVTTGIGGTISLCQGTFAAIGAFTTAQLVDHVGLGVLPAMVVGALLAATVGAVLSLPVIRLAGIYPALATLAFALMFEGIFVPLDWVSGGAIPLTVPRPLIGSIDFAGDRAFLLLAVLLLAVLSLAVIAVREGTTGRFLLAVQGSGIAAQSIGINPARQRAIASSPVPASPASVVLGQLLRPGQLSPVLQLLRRLGLAGAHHHHRGPVGPGRGRLRRLVLHRATTPPAPLRVARQLPRQPSRYERGVRDGARHREAGVVPGRGLHPVRHRRPHLRQAPRGHHRGPDLGQHPPHPRRHRTPARARDRHRRYTGNRPAPRRQAPLRRPPSRRRAAMSERSERKAPLLSATHVGKRFAGIAALVDVSVRVDPGEMVALIGPNGAGKSTLFNCLSGLLRPDSGRIELAGRDLSGLAPHQRARLGLARTFQRIELFPGLSVRDHLLVADRAHRGVGGLWRDLTLRSRPTAEERERCDAVLELVGLTDDADRLAHALTLGRGRVVELARALMCQPVLLFLDEPSSGLDDDERHEMATVLEHVQREEGHAVLLCEHDVPFVARLATRTYVLDLGRIIAEGDTDDVLARPEVQAAYLGQGLTGATSHE